MTGSNWALAAVSPMSLIDVIKGDGGGLRLGWAVKWKEAPTMNNTSSRAAHLYSGRLIIVEGCDGSGKSTQIYLLKRWLEASGHPVYFTEWNSSDLIKATTKKAKKERILTPTTFSLIHACDFADRYERLILPHLQAGYLVLADRYMYTAFARDAVRGCDSAWIRNVYRFAVQPDLTFYFQAPPEVSLDRILSGRPALKYYEAGMDLGLSNDPAESFKLFQGLIKAEYDRMAGRYGFVVMDATRPIYDQQTELRAIVARTIVDYQALCYASRVAVDLAVNSRPLRSALGRSPVFSEVEDLIAAGVEQKTAEHV